MEDFDNVEICRDVFEGETLSIQVLDRDSVRKINYTKPYAIISITDPEKRHASLMKSANLTGTLLLKCNDVSESAAKIKSVATSLRAFSEEMATQVAEFATSQIELGTTLFVINCEAGISRSAGIASALSWRYNHDESFFMVHYKPNRWIRKQMLTALKAPNE